MSEYKNLERGVVARYERDYGVHQIVTSANMHVYAVSQPDWLNFYRSLERMLTTSGIILSPELMTTPHPLAELPTFAELARERIDNIRLLSTRHKSGVIALGTMIGTAFSRTNGLVVIERGEQVAVAQKRARGCMSPEERKTFYMDNSTEQRAVFEDPSVAVAICSELLGIGMDARGRRRSQREPHIQQRRTTGLISDDTKTLLVSSCWGVPNQFHQDTTAEQRDTRYGGVLETIAQVIMDEYPNMQDIVMCDRAIPQTGVPPYNAHFFRS